MLPLPGRSPALKLLSQPAATRQQLSIGKFFEHRQRRRATRGVAAERAAQAARPRSIHDLRAAGDRRQRHAAAERLRSEDQIGLDAEMSAGKQLPGAAEAGLYFISNKDDAALAADLRQRRQKSGRRHDKPAFPKHRLNHDGRNRLGSHHTAEGLVEQLS